MSTIVLICPEHGVEKFYPREVVGMVFAYPGRDPLLQCRANCTANNKLFMNKIPADDRDYWLHTFKNLGMDMKVTVMPVLEQPSFTTDMHQVAHQITEELGSVIDLTQLELERPDLFKQ